MSKIQWTEQTWNPIRGCSMAKGSEAGGCLNCYAARQAARGLPGMNSPTTGESFAVMRDSGPRWTGEIELIEHMLDIPLRRKKPTTYFVNSMSDLFHESLPDAAIDRIFAVMALCPQHTFQVLTKRADRMGNYIDGRQHGRVCEAADDVHGGNHGNAPFPLPNVWLGVSCESRADFRVWNRINLLRQTPAAVRFLSLEPLLGDLGTLNLDDIDWVIVGGESGPGARPCDVAWIRSIVAQCAAVGVACFVKQLGARTIDNTLAWARCGNCGWIGTNAELPRDPKHKCGADECPSCHTGGCITCCYASEQAAESGEGPGDGSTRMRLADRKGGDPAEWPEDLRVRQMPAHT